MNIVFSEEDAICIKPRDNDPLVITVQHGNWDIRRVRIDLNNLVDVLFWDTFQKLQLNLDGKKRFTDSLTGLLGEHVQIMGHVNLKNPCDEGAEAKTINVNYLTVDTISPYNIILGHPTINSLGEVVSTRCLTLKYPLINGRVGTIWGDQQVDLECYLRNLETTREELPLVDVRPSEVPNANFEGWNPRLDVEAE